MPAFGPCAALALPPGEAAELISSPLSSLVCAPRSCVVCPESLCHVCRRSRSLYPSPAATLSQCTLHLLPPPSPGALSTLIPAPPTFNRVQPNQVQTQVQVYSRLRSFVPPFPFLSICMCICLVPISLRQVNIFRVSISFSLDNVSFRDSLCLVRVCYGYAFDLYSPVNRHHPLELSTPR